MQWFSALYFSSNLPSRSFAYNRGQIVSLEYKKDSELKKQARGRHLEHVGIVGMSDGPDKG